MSTPPPRYASIWTPRQAAAAGARRAEAARRKDRDGDRLRRAERADRGCRRRRADPGRRLRSDGRPRLRLNGASLDGRDADADRGRRFAARSGRSSSPTCPSAASRSRTSTPSSTRCASSRRRAPTPSKLEAPVRRSPGAGDRRCRHPRDGPHRADAAIGDGARRLQGPGAHGREGTNARRRRPCARGRRLLRGRARGGAGRSRRRGDTHRLSIPTIGIGAGSDCDGQVLVWHDLLGLYEGRAPRFVKLRGEVGDEIGALERYAERSGGRFPASSTRTRCRRRSCASSRRRSPWGRTRTKRELIV